MSIDRSLRIPLLLLCAAVTSFGVPSIAQTLYGSMGGPTQSGPLAGAIVTVDTTTGVATVLGTPEAGIGITGLAVDGLGRLIGSTSNAGAGPRLIEIDKDTGALVGVLANLTLGGSPSAVTDLAYDPVNDILYGNSAGIGTEDALLSIDISTGVMTNLGDMPAAGGFKALGFNASGTLYMLAGFDNLLHTIDPADGSSTGSVSIGTAIGALGLTVRPSDGEIFFTELTGTSGRSLYRADPNTGNRTLIGSTTLAANLHDLVFVEPTPVAPAISGRGSLAMILGMIVALALLSRRLAG